MADEPARFFEGFGAVRAAGREMRFERGALFGIERTESVGFEQLAELVAVLHVVACNPSFKRSKPLRIQLFTVPSGSFSVAAISEWLSPSKYASSMAFFCCGVSEAIRERTRSARRFSSKAFSYSGAMTSDRQFVGLIFAAALALAFQAKMIEGAVARHGAEPGNKRAARGIVLSGVAPELQEDVLNDLFGS